MVAQRSSTIEWEAWLTEQFKLRLHATQPNKVAQFEYSRRSWVFIYIHKCPSERKLRAGEAQSKAARFGEF